MSGINLFVGGPLTILHECLAYLEQATHVHNEFAVVALVHNKKEFERYKNIRIVEYRKSRQSWFYRLYYEYIHFRSLSRKLNVYLWFSLHDITPNVIAEKRAVYCHNPAPFYKVSAHEKELDKGFALFTMLYKYLYAVNIKKNDFVVVQQNWIRKEFIRLFGLPFQHIIVAHPEIAHKEIIVNGEPKKSIQFLYPALPRVFKNFEVIVNAVSILNEEMEESFEVVFTIDGSENKYADYIKNLAVNLSQIKLKGLQTKEHMNRLYQESSCVLFPSKLETWGLPLTETKLYNKPLLAANLPYARETIGTYDKVSFFEPDDARQLAALMKQLAQNTIVFSGNTEEKTESPFSNNWGETFQWLLA